ncbi:hypothetical protein PAXRUDRAFT_823084 [Paxillus rubicundulus Ve08.2h10]|uniref:Uncharacterized protein n=1 Tax=Paxillus rubicundulus Ve08.2h10 TaxID=930991 RepID=A0A0D0DVT6_9AGAM|nr:hypothetical protein PAXRUDRAFT_823084 [Paxillus rubicundulus Ve08.2h10]
MSDAPTPDPNDFKPERFLDSDGTMNDGTTNYNHLGFRGAHLSGQTLFWCLPLVGPRMCICGLQKSDTHPY